MPYATNAADATRIYFEDDGGAGAPVVVMGGFLDPVPVVRTLPVVHALRRLGDEVRLVFVDHRGHGRSDAPHDPAAYVMPRRVGDVVAVMDALDIERAHLVGSSWGGRLALGVAEHAPERVRSLVVMGQHPYAMDPEGPLARVVAAALEASKERGIEALVEAFEDSVGRYPPEVRDHYLACDAAAMRAAFTAAMDEGAVSEDLGSWGIPCLISVAEHDVDFFGSAKRAASEIPGARFVAIRETDHLGLDTAEIDPAWPAIVDLLRRA
jgi:pimeloyl-ACP methyl ester carboxylesterase